MQKLFTACSALLSLSDLRGGFAQASEMPPAETVIEETSEQSASPKVGDWFEANWFDDLVKIPLTIDQGTNWYANLIVGDEDSQNTAGKCMFDNNSPRMVIYPGYTASGTQDDWYTAPANTCDTTREYELQSDGISIRGYACRARMCIGSLQTDPDLQLDVHTTVCNDNQAFLDATNVPSTDWTYYYNKYGATNSVCGLGKEKASIRALSFNSLAASRGDMLSNVYSFEIYPHLQYFGSANSFRNIKHLSEGKVPEEGHAPVSHHLGKLPYEFSLEEVSYLTLGGYDKKDNKTEIVWYDASDSGDSWNITANGMWLND